MDAVVDFRGSRAKNGYLALADWRQQLCHQGFVLLSVVSSRIEFIPFLTPCRCFWADGYRQNFHLPPHEGRNLPEADRVGFPFSGLERAGVHQVDGRPVGIQMTQFWVVRRSSCTSAILFGVCVGVFADDFGKNVRVRSYRFIRALNRQTPSLLLSLFVISVSTESRDGHLIMKLRNLFPWCFQFFSAVPCIYLCRK